MSADIMEVNDRGFNRSVLEAAKPVLVDFWAPWCGPCNALAPIVEDLSRQYKEQLDFAKFNIDENPITPGKYGIKAIPTILIFKDGQLAETNTGLTSRSNLEQAIKRVIADEPAKQPFIVQ